MVVGLGQHTLYVGMDKVFRYPGFRTSRKHLKLMKNRSKRLRSKDLKQIYAKLLITSTLAVSKNKKSDHQFRPQPGSCSSSFASHDSLSKADLGLTLGQAISFKLNRIPSLIENMSHQQPKWDLNPCHAGNLSQIAHQSLSYTTHNVLKQHMYFKWNNSAGTQTTCFAPSDQRDQVISVQSNFPSVFRLRQISSDSTLYDCADSCSHVVPCFTILTSLLWQSHSTTPPKKPVEVLQVSAPAL